MCYSIYEKTGRYCTFTFRASGINEGRRLSRNRRATKQRKKKKKSEERDRTRLLQNCQRDGYDRMEEWRHFVKQCETLHNQKNHKYPQQQHQHHHITTFFFHHQHNTTQYHTSNSKCKSIDSYNRTGRFRSLSRNPREWQKKPIIPLGGYTLPSSLWHSWGGRNYDF